MIVGDAVKSPVPAMPDGRADGGKKPLGVVDALHGIKARRCRCEKMGGQSVNLLGVKNGVAF